MKNFVTSSIRMLAAVLVVCGLWSLTDAQAQTYKRHALLEEGTGTWCGWCPYGAYTIDSMERLMGNNLVVISWHGPKSYNEPMALPASDTAASYFGATGYPWASVGRTKAMSGAYTSFPNPWYTNAKADAQKDPNIDLRIANVAYNSGTRTVEFDVDITPWDVKKLVAESATSQYVSVVVLTEDDYEASEAQHRYATSDGTFEAGDFADFRHLNVARKVAGKVQGDVFTMGTGKEVVYPIRRHYKMTVKNEWNADKMEIKAIVGRRTSTSFGYMDAAQSPYFGAALETPANAVWAVLPRDGETAAAGQEKLIVWGVGGATGACKLEYSIDGGKTWTAFAASVAASPYKWTVPTSLEGQTVQVRITDVANANLKAITGSFEVGAAAKIMVSKPVAGETIDGGSNYSIMYTTSGEISGTPKAQYSLDNGSTWVDIGAGSNGTVAWSVPNTASTTALVRVMDNGSVIGTSGVFTIKETTIAAKITVTKPATGEKVSAGQPYVIELTTQGNMTGNLVGEYTVDNGTTWTTIGNAVMGVIAWDVPAAPAAEAMVRVKDEAGIVGTSGSFSIVTSGISIVMVNGAPNIESGKPIIIGWTATGDIGANVRLDYSTDNKTTWTEIAKGIVSSTHSYTWIGAPNMQNAVVRVQSNTDVVAYSEPFNVGSTNSVAIGQANGFALMQNYPNPFNPSTTIAFELAKKSFVTLAVYDLMGREIARPVNEVKEMGAHSVMFDASKLSSGTYVYRLTAGGHTFEGKMTLNK